VSSLPLLLLLPASGLAAQAAIDIGAPVPPLELRDLDGKVHALAALRPDVVVLEWTSCLCPAAAGLHDTRIVADTRAALPATGVRWLMVDSSWYAPVQRQAIARSRDRLGLDAVPYLLDSDGVAATALGAEVTPQVCVIDGDGRLAYRGAITTADSEGERRNPVLEAVRALLDGKPVPQHEVAAQGCALHRTAPPGLAIGDVDEDAAANALYEQARAAARAGSQKRAVELLERAVAAGHPWPFRAMTDAAFAPAWRDADSRAALRQLLLERAPTGRLTMVSPDEPGEPLVVAGTMRDSDGAPIAGAELSLFHTDAAGWYSAGSTAGDNPRLAGAVRTDRHGRYRIRTIFPGHYATSPDGPAHIHARIRADGYRMLTGQRASIFFADDPALRGAALEEIRGDGCAIVAPSRNAEGVRTYLHDVVLERAR
jgi:protocatechuate 3,4-dioxygenase beta subunit